VHELSNNQELNQLPVYLINGAILAAFGVFLIAPLVNTQPAQGTVAPVEQLGAAML